MRMYPLLFLFLIYLLAKGTWGYCPESCICDNTNLSANCSFSEETMKDVQPLDVIPIMLNPSIRDLSASNNRVRKLEGAIRVYKYLEVLNLSHNELKTLGRAQFVESFRLQVLDLSNNFLTAIHKQSFQGLSALITLDLNDNAISTLEDAYFEATSSMVELRLKGNKISHLSNKAFMGLGRLRVLHLEGNILTDLRPQWFAPLENLRFLYLDSNQITHLPDNSLPLSALRMLSLKDNQLSSDISEGSPFRALKSMDTLDLSRNMLKQVPNVFLREASRLRHLDISENPITSLDEESFRSMFVLETLRGNKMEALTKIHPLTFMENIKLQEIVLDSNPLLQPFPFGLFQSNNRIRIISLRNGSWSTLSPHQLPLTSLEVLHLGGLPLYCNCSLTWLWDLYQRNRNASPRVDLDTIWCENLSGSPRLEEVSVDALACTDFTRLLVAVSLGVIVTASLLLLLVGIACVIRVRRGRRKSSQHHCLYMKDETMIYKFSHPPVAPSSSNQEEEKDDGGGEEEPFYEVPKYSSAQDDDPKSSASSSKYSSSGYVGSELWEPEYYSSTGIKGGGPKGCCYGSPHNSGSSTGSSLGTPIERASHPPRNNTGSLSSSLYFSPSRGQLIHHAGNSIMRNGGNPGKNPHSTTTNNRVNLYV